MPPKQAQESNSNYKAINVLPLVLDSVNAEQCIRKSVSIKKNIDNNKIIQILKEKGLEPHLNQNQISSQGRIFVCQNYKTVCEQTIASINKPIDPKKDSKKGGKQSKKQQAVQEIQQPLEINFEKDCNDFYFLLDFPANQQELQSIIKSNIRIDILVIIQSKVKPGSRLPNFSLLNKEQSVDDLQNTLKNTIAEKIEDQKEKIERNIQTKKKMIQKFKNLRGGQIQAIKQGTIILQIPYLMDLSKPEVNNDNFINSLYQKICESTIKKKQYDGWRQNRKTIHMIQPMRQTITKEVQVEKNQDKGKKGGKSQPVFQTVEEVVETRYQSLPQNIKSDLKQYQKMKKIIKNSQNKNTSVINNIIDSCLQVFEDDTQKNTIQIAEKIHNMFEAKPLNKVKQQNLINRVRQISYPKDVSLKYQLKFNFQPIQSDISFLQLAHKADGNLQSLKIEFLVGKMQQMIKKTLPKIKWDFGDRQNIERFSAQRIISVINEQLLKDPEIISGYLQSQGIKLLILTRTNPPGRVLYHNNIFDWKVLPDFQNWVDSFNGNEQMLQKDNFWDYDCSRCGNLAVKSKNMMPTDNTIIKDEIFTVGDKKDNLIQFYQDNCIFGMKKKNNKNIYWQKFQNQINLKAFKSSQKAIKKVQKIKVQKIQNQQQQKRETVQIVEQQVQIQKTQVWIKYKQNYNVSFSPYPTIYWINNKFQNKRQFGSKGQITCYRKDGSIDIYYPDGSISQFRNGKWIRIVNNKRIVNEQKQDLKIQEIIQGQATIRIRQDQTVFIQDKNNIKRIIFPDSTQLYFNQDLKKRQIRNPQGPIIRIHLPRDFDFNVIGYGSAFAYLGFKNILQRSYDDYLYEFIDLQFSSHLYIEQFQSQKKKITEEVRLLCFKDGSQIRILGQSGKIIYISPDKQQVNTEEHLNQRWLQLFTTSQNFGEGVYDIDIKNGCINTFDKESNRFITKVDNPSVVKIAVSFSIDQSKKISENFPNGFHVPDQNYFLPPPNNNIPPRIFSINSDGSGIEYLSQNQIGYLNNFHIQEQYQGQTTIRQYSRLKASNKNFMNFTFTEDVDINKFGLPERLRSQKTMSNLVPNYFDTLQHRVIEKINWNSDFSRVIKIQTQIRDQIKEKIQKMGKIK